MTFKNVTINLGEGEVSILEIEKDPIFEATKKSARTHTSRFTEND